MTLPRPIGTVSRVLESIGPKTLLCAVLSLAGFVAKGSQELSSHEKRLDVHREELGKKIDSATYDRDQERLFQEIHDVRQLEDQILLMERRH